MSCKEIEIIVPKESQMKREADLEKERISSKKDII